MYPRDEHTNSTMTSSLIWIAGVAILLFAILSSLRSGPGLKIEYVNTGQLLLRISRHPALFMLSESLNIYLNRPIATGAFACVALLVALKMKAWRRYANILTVVAVLLIAISFIVGATNARSPKVSEYPSLFVTSALAFYGLAVISIWNIQRSTAYGFASLGIFIVVFSDSVFASMYFGGSSLIDVLGGFFLGACLLALSTFLLFKTTPASSKF